VIELLENWRRSKKLYNNSDSKDRNRLIFTYNGIDIDLKELIDRNGSEKINTIKELRKKTGLSLSDAKTIIDGAYFGKIHLPEGLDGKKNNNKGFLIILLWLICFPIMAINYVIKSKKFSKPVKVLLSLVIAFFTWPLMLPILEPQMILLLAVFFLIYKYKKYSEEKELKEQILKEEEYRIESERINKIVKETLDLVFADNEMSNRLTKFIIQHTKRYDDGEINYVEYSNTLDMFLIYINKKIDNQVKIPINRANKDIGNYVGENPSLTIDREVLKLYIESKKLKVYCDDMKNIININGYKTTEDAAKVYLDIFGEKGLDKLNLEIFSEALDKDYDEISSIVEKEYNKIKDEYEMMKLERHLFKSGASKKI